MSKRYDECIWIVEVFKLFGLMLLFFSVLGAIFTLISVNEYNMEFHTNIVNGYIFKIRGYYQAYKDGHEFYYCHVTNYTDGIREVDVECVPSNMEVV